MADGVVKMPTPAHAVDKMLKEGYCARCIKNVLGLTGTSADEVDIVARRMLLDGLCIRCKIDRRERLDIK